MTEIYTPVARFPTIRVMMAIAYRFNYEIGPLNVKTAFLDGTLEESVYMEMPAGYKIEKKGHKVCKLVKALYGLTVSPKYWNIKFNKAMLKLKFEKYSLEPCLYI